MENLLLLVFPLKDIQQTGGLSWRLWDKLADKYRSVVYSQHGGGHHIITIYQTHFQICVDGNSFADVVSHAWLKSEGVV